MSLRNKFGRPGLDSLVGSCEHGNDPLYAIKCGEFLDWLGNCCFTEKDCPAHTYRVY